MAISPLSICHIVPQLLTGGMEKLIVELARHVDRRKFALHFISLGERGQPADEIESNGWPVTAFEQPSGVRLDLVLRVALLLRQRKIDIVHSHNIRGLLYASAASGLARSPAHLNTRHGQGGSLSARQTVAVRLASRLVDRMVCVAEDVVRVSAQQGIPRQKLCAIWNGIDVSRFRFSGSRPDGPAVMVGRMSQEKDVGTLIRAAAIIIPQCPAFRLEIAGGGPCLPELKELAAALGVSEHVRFLGEISDVGALLSRARLFILTSLREGISLAILEAMAVGLPVVATSVGGNPEVIREGHTGMLVPPGRPDDLAHAIIGLYRDTEKMQEMGVLARRRVEELFDVRKMVARYESLYATLAYPARSKSSSGITP